MSITFTISLVLSDLSADSDLEQLHKDFYNFLYTKNIEPLELTIKEGSIEILVKFFSEGLATAFIKEISSLFVSITRSLIRRGGKMIKNWKEKSNPEILETSEENSALEATDVVDEIENTYIQGIQNAIGTGNPVLVEDFYKISPLEPLLTNAKRAVLKATLEVEDSEGKKSTFEYTIETVEGRLKSRRIDEIFDA